MPIVYRATNTVNGKSYIGVTVKTLEMRAYQHVWTAKTRRPGARLLTRAIRKHGEDVFKFDVLERYETIQDAMAGERHYIELMKPEYNLAAGGVGPSGVRWSAKRHRIMRKSLRTAWTEDRRQRMSAALKGRKPSEETLRKMREARDPAACYKSVVCLNDGMFHVSIGHAARHYCVLASRISASCTGREVSANGLFFCFAKEPLTPKQIARRMRRIQKRLVARFDASKDVRSRPVICLTTGISYPSVRAAAKDVGLNSNRIVQLCQRGGTTRSGLAFMYADQDAPPVKLARDPAVVEDGICRRNAALKRAYTKRSRPVLCVTDGTEHASASAAARSYGVAHATVWNAITYSDGRVGERQFRFLEKKP
jgi:group I intron endonuclease